METDIVRLSADFGYLRRSAASIVLNRAVLTRGIVTINNSAFGTVVVYESSRKYVLLVERTIEIHLTSCAKTPRTISERRTSA